MPITDYMMRPRILVLALVSLLALPACTTTRPYVDERYDGWEDHAPASELAYQVFLIGDTGDLAPDQPKGTLQLLKKRLDQAGDDAAVVFLGNNLYPGGLPDSTNLAARVEAERRLLEQLKTVEAFPGRILFIPGNKDWNDSEPGGQHFRVASDRDSETLGLYQGVLRVPDP